MSDNAKMSATGTRLKVEEVLERLQKYLAHNLRNGTLTLSSNRGDGRNDSAENERELSLALQLYASASEWFQDNGLRIEVARARYWYDFLVRNEDETLWIPVNVKVSSLQGNDNVSSKEGLFYALTGVRPIGPLTYNWDRYCANLADNLGADRRADYYLLVVSKATVGTVFWTSLKQLEAVTSNGNNPPFQCNWARNQKRVERSFEDASAMLLSALRETFRLRADAYLSFEKHLDGVLEEIPQGEACDQET